MSKIPYVVAHRGLSALYPENTLSAFQAAVDLGVDWIELDVVTTADGALIVSHDTTANRCTNGSSAFRTMTLAQVKALDAGSHFDSRFAAERIPTLEEVIALVAHTPVRLCIEIKGDTPDEFRATARAAVTLLQQHDFLRRASLSSFDPACLRSVRVWESLLSTNLDPTPQNGSLTPWELCQQCLRSNVNVMSHEYETLTPAIIDEAHAHGLALWAWTVNDEEAIRCIAAMDVDAILSDNVRLVKSILTAN